MGLITRSVNHEKTICDRVKLNEINCHGCTTTDNDKLFKHRKECEIRIEEFKNMS